MCHIAQASSLNTAVASMHVLHVQSVTSFVAVPSVPSVAEPTTDGLATLMKVSASYDTFRLPAAAVASVSRN